MGTIPGLRLRQRAHVKKIRAAKGIRAAIAAGFIQNIRVPGLLPGVEQSGWHFLDHSKMGIDNNPDPWYKGLQPSLPYQDCLLRADPAASCPAHSLRSR
jgi:hypothetical protein